MSPGLIFESGYFLLLSLLRFIFATLPEVIDCFRCDTLPFLFKSNSDGLLYQIELVLKEKWSLPSIAFQVL